jgi:cytochrome c oxidase accessory protein FixG
MMATPHIDAPGRVLSTLESDGSRRWLRPRLSKGPLLHARRAMAYFLIAIFFAIPFITIHGKPAILLDIVHRRFTLLGYTFLPTDTLLLALFMVSVFISIFLLTALFGRLWCGWACPQTVYMEFVYRPLERIFEGTIGRGGPRKAGTADWRRVAYFFTALLVSILPAHTFLAYFVGVDQLSHWVRQSPLHHPTPFLVMLGTTVLMMFDFYYFREQLCILACPYGRFQSVLLDRFSLIVSYDRKRGEPRGKRTKGTTHGDCIDCGLCVATCPTGIDIRNGLQMECINCTQCIDACNTVMTKIGTPKGLIRYSSQAAMEGGKKRIFRPRVVFYPTILAIVLTALLLAFRAKDSTDVTLLRNFGNPFTQLPDGTVENSFRLKLMNRMDHPAEYTIEVVNNQDARVVIVENPLHVLPDVARTEGVAIILPRKAFVAGFCDVTLRISDGHELKKDVSCRLLGPAASNEESPGTGEHRHDHERKD